MTVLTKAQAKRFVTSISWTFTCSNCAHEEIVDEGSLPDGWRFSIEDEEALCDLCSGEGTWRPEPLPEPEYHDYYGSEWGTDL